MTPDSVVEDLAASECEGMLTSEATVLVCHVSSTNASRLESVLVHMYKAIDETICTFDNQSDWSSPSGRQFEPPLQQGPVNTVAGLWRFATCADFFAISLLDRCSGKPSPVTRDVVTLAVELQYVCSQICVSKGGPLRLSCAVHYGPGNVAVFGKHFLSFEVVGEAITVPRQLLKHIPPGSLVATSAALQHLKPFADQYYWTRLSQHTVPCAWPVYQLLTPGAGSTQGNVSLGMWPSFSHSAARSASSRFSSAASSSSMSDCRLPSDEQHGAYCCPARPDSLMAGVVQQGSPAPIRACSTGKSSSAASLYSNTSCLSTAEWLDERVQRRYAAWLAALFRKVDTAVLLLRLILHYHWRRACVLPNGCQDVVMWLPLLLSICLPLYMMCTCSKRWYARNRASILLLHSACYVLFWAHVTWPYIPARCSSSAVDASCGVRSQAYRASCLKVLAFDCLLLNMALVVPYRQQLLQNAITLATLLPMLCGSTESPQLGALPAAQYMVPTEWPSCSAAVQYVLASMVGFVDHMAPHVLLYACGAAVISSTGGYLVHLLCRCAYDKQ